MPESSGPLKMSKAAIQLSALCGALLAAVTCPSKVQASLLDGGSHPPASPVVEILGCRLHGLGVVCSPGPLLPGRLRKKDRHYKEEVEPSNGQNGQSSNTSKGGTASKNKGSHPSQGVSDKDTAKATTEHPATEEESAGVHACPPGDGVLEKPNASGSYCEPAGQNAGATAGQSAGPTLMDKVTSPTPTGDAVQSQTGGGAANSTASPTQSAGVGSQPSTGATGSSSPTPSAAAVSQSSIGGTPASGTVQAAPTQMQSDSYCCSAPTASNGQPAAPLQACGADQSSALNALVSAAGQKKVTLGSVQCAAH
jgi:hypothetical protein